MNKCKSIFKDLVITKELKQRLYRLRSHLKPLISWIFWRHPAQMADSPDKWLFYVDSSSQGRVCFKLALHPEKRQKCGLSSLGPSLRYFLTGYPVDDSWTAKNPEFAYQESAILKSLASSGYKQVWSIWGGLVDGSGSSGDGEHTVGRKRRRQPTINQGEEAVEHNSVGQTTPNKGIGQLYKHGILIGFPHENVVEYRIEIGRILQQHGFKTAFELRKTPDDQWMCEYGGQDFQLVKGISSGNSSEEPEPLHPAFRDRESNFIFHSLDEVLEVLEKCPVHNHIKDIKQLVPQLETDSGTDLSLQHPFLVIEGLDGTGKTTLVNSLSDRLGAVQLHTPPASLQPLRQQFVSQPTLIKRVYYSFGNYLMGKEVVQNCANRPVIMDRYWHSTAAYTMAAQCCGDTNSLPPHDSYVYQWPGDLPRPTLVVLLSISEEERQRRLKERTHSTQKEITEEEKTLQDRLVRERLLEAYRRMQNPGVVEISADGTREEVLDAVLLQLRAHQILTE